MDNDEPDVLESLDRSVVEEQILDSKYLAYENLSSLLGHDLTVVLRAGVAALKPERHEVECTYHYYEAGWNSALDHLCHEAGVAAPAWRGKL